MSKEKPIEFTPYNDGYSCGQFDQLNGCVQNPNLLAKTLGYEKFEYILDFVSGYEYGVVCEKAIEDSYEGRED